MSKKSFIDAVKVEVPCSEDWEKMHGNDRVRFCSHCAKDVKNLSAVTRKEAARLVRSSDGNICIRYIKNPVTQQPLFAEQLLQITRRTPGFAAGLMTASLALSTMTYSQSEPPTPEPDAPVTTSQDSGREQDEPAAEDPETTADPTLGSIEGIILDPSGKPVPDVSLMIMGSGPNDHIEYETTDAEGRYRFKELEAGTYSLRIASSTGLMKKATRGMQLAEGQQLVHNVYVTVAPIDEGESGTGTGSGWGYGGAMAVVEYGLPLNRAVADNDIAAVRKLLSEGEKVNGKDKNYDDITPLFLAVENGRVEIVKLLLDHGAKINAVDKTKRTPLMFIDSDASIELIEVLLNAGAKVNARDKSGNTVLLATVGSINVDVLNALIKGGANVNDADDDGETALMKAAEEDDIETVKALVVAGAEINERDKSGESAWDKTSKTDIEEFLEVHGAAVDQSNVQVSAPAKAEITEQAIDETEQ